MKIRQGLVSNSSSASYVIVGMPAYSEESKGYEIARALGAVDEDDHYGNFNYDNHYDKSAGEGLYDFEGIGVWSGEGELYYVGLNGGPRFRENKTLSSIREEFIKLVREKTDVEITEDDVDMIVTEVHS